MFCLKELPGVPLTLSLDQMWHSDLPGREKGGAADAKAKRREGPPAKICQAVESRLTTPSGHGEAKGA